MRLNLPVFGMFTFLSAGWFRMKSGVSPFAATHWVFPVFRLIAVMRLYGGLTIGIP